MRLDVPAYRQEQEATCIPAAIRMVLAYLGDERPEAEIARVCGTTAAGTIFADAVRGIESLGYAAFAFEGASLDLLIEVVHRGLPVITPIQAAILPHAAGGVHAIVIYGFEGDALLCIDPHLGSSVRVPVPLFLIGWRALHSRVLIIRRTYWNQRGSQT